MCEKNNYDYGQYCASKNSGQDIDNKETDNEKDDNKIIEDY